jgi:CheY-like chemotaxis protein
MAGPTLLVVDDDPMIVRLLEMSLGFEGYSVITASDGEEGIEQARSGRPDLVILDLMMPGIDGLEVTRILRSDPATSSIPVLLLSARNTPVDIARGRDAGVNAYMAKPFDQSALCEQVAALLAPS